MPNGWSGRGGRTNNAYIRSGDSCGSSSGSAVSVAANLVTVALGVETDGSIICPSMWQSLVGLKPGVGRVSVEGTIKVSFTQDSLGPMTRTVTDAVYLFSVIASGPYNNLYSYNEENVTELEYSYEKNQEIRIGVLRSPNWETLAPELAEEIPVLENILVKLGDAGFTMVDPVEGAPGTDIGISNISEWIVFFHEFKYETNKYLANSVVRPSNNIIRTVADMIKFNDEFPPKEGYKQTRLLACEATDGILNSTYIANRDKNKRAAQNYLDFIFTKYDLDAIVIPSDNFDSMPAIAGYPHITVPAGFLKKGLPFGISFYAEAGSEEKLLYIAYQLEKVHKARRTSVFLD